MALKRVPTKSQNHITMLNQIQCDLIEKIETFHFEKSQKTY